MGLVNCNWCQREVSSDKTFNVNGDIICSKCNESAKINKCIECGSPYNMMYKGRCLKCYEVHRIKESKEREELINAIDSELMQGDVDYEEWVTTKNSFSDYNENSELVNSTIKRLWVQIKLNKRYSPEIINKHMEDAVALVDRSFSKIVNNKCSIFIIVTELDKNRVLSIPLENIIDSENNVYIIKETN